MKGLPVFNMPLCFDFKRLSVLGSLLLLSCLLLGYCIYFPDFTSRDNAFLFVQEGLQRIHSLKFAHVNQEMFPSENIDLDGNGHSIFETRQFEISNNVPFSGMKTIKIIVSWPDPKIITLSEKSEPDLCSISVQFMIDQTSFS